MFKKISTLFFAVCICFIASSCVYKEINRNNANLKKIRKGMTKKEVIAIMGEPVKGQSYCTDDVFFYFTRQVWMDGLTTRDECTPIAFDESGRVKGWGKDFNTGIYEFNATPVRSYHKKDK